MSASRNVVDVRGEHIHQIKVPLPFPLRWVNAYLVRGDNGFTLIDPGLHTEDAVQCWQEALRLIGLTFKDIHQIILTHHHPDHYGLAGWFQQQSDALVWLSEAGIQQVDYLWGPGRQAGEDIHRLFLRHGMEEHTGELLKEHMENFVDFVGPQPVISPIQEDAKIWIGDRLFKTIHTPGHAYGHLCFHHEESGDLFCGDHVLPQITPNVSLLPGFDDQPLQSFLTSLDRMSQLHVQQAFPGHRDPFTDFSERCRQLISHHADRLDRLEEMLDQPRTAAELCQSFFGRQLSIHQLRFAMGETLAHLLYLRDSARLFEVDRNGIIYYCR